MYTVTYVPGPKLYQFRFNSSKKEEKKRNYSVLQKKLLLGEKKKKLQYFLIQTAKMTSPKASTAKIYFLNGSPLTLKFIVISIIEERL